MSHPLRVRILAVLLVTGLLIEVGSSPVFADDPKIYKGYTAYFKGRNGTADAQADFKKKTCKVIAAMGVGHFYPGLEHEEGDRLKKTYGSKHLKGTTDVVENEAHWEYMQVAFAYAGEYNKALLGLASQ